MLLNREQQIKTEEIHHIGLRDGGSPTVKYQPPNNFTIGFGSFVSRSVYSGSTAGTVAGDVHHYRLLPWRFIASDVGRHVGPPHVTAPRSRSSSRVVEGVTNFSQTKEYAHRDSRSSGVTGMPVAMRNNTASWEPRRRLSWGPQKITSESPQGDSPKFDIAQRGALHSYGKMQRKRWAGEPVVHRELGSPGKGEGEV